MSSPTETDPNPIPGAEQRTETRFEVSGFVRPHARHGVAEGYLAVNVSRSGMSVLRLRDKSRFIERPRDGLDQRYAWVAVPLPRRTAYVRALAETVHRKSVGPLESVGLRFRYMSPEDRRALDAYLNEEDVPADDE